MRQPFYLPPLDHGYPQDFKGEKSGVVPKGHYGCTWLDGGCAPSRRGWQVPARGAEAALGLRSRHHGRITQDEYDKKARELKERQTEIALRIEQHKKGEEHFRTTLESLS
jgi:hypothetical protein